MTGFRVSRSGWYGLDPVDADLFTFGKVMGGGLPAAAFGGRADLMDQLAPVGPVYQAGTLSGNPVAVAAGLTTLRLLHRRGLRRAATRWPRCCAARPSAALFAAGVPHRVQQAGNMFSVFFVPDERQVRDYDDARTPGHRPRTPPSSTRCWPAASTCRRRRSRRGSSTPTLAGEPLDRVLEALPAAARAAAAADPPRRRRTPRRRTPGAARERVDRRDDRRPPAAARRGVQPRPGILYGRLPGFRLSEAGEAMARDGRGAGSPAGTSPTWCPARWSGPSRPPRRSPRRSACRSRIDERLIEAGNAFEGKPFGAATARCADPADTGGGCATRGARRGASPTSRSRPGCSPPSRPPGTPPAGHEAVCVSHQLPIWTLRLHLEGRRYLHDPRRRECGAGQRHLAHLRAATGSVGIGYAEPAGATDPDAVPGA